jgi:hypothetical protein
MVGIDAKLVSLFLCEWACENVRNMEVSVCKLLWGCLWKLPLSGIRPLSSSLHFVPVVQNSKGCWRK